MQTLRDADGPVTRLELAPNWLMPPVVIATSPQGGVVAVAEQGERRTPRPAQASVQFQNKRMRG